MSVILLFRIWKRISKNFPFSCEINFSESSVSSLIESGFQDKYF